jgi:plastocyanin
VIVTMPAGVGSSNTLNFSPASITVVIGVNNTVTWMNKDQSIHTVTATDKSFDSGNILGGASFTYTFKTAGTYTYVCIYHGWMKGTVVVKSAGLGVATP